MRSEDFVINKPIVIRKDNRMNPKMHSQESGHELIYCKIGHKGSSGQDCRISTKRTSNECQIHITPTQRESQIYALQLEVESAIEEHLELLRQNEEFKRHIYEKANAAKIEYEELAVENETLIADVTRRRKEIKACKRIIQILQAEITKTNSLQSMVDLTSYPDH